MELSTGAGQGQGDGEIKAGPLLAAVGRRQADDHPRERQPQAAVAQGGAHPFPGFLDRRIGQANDDQGRQAGGEIHLHLDGIGLDPRQGGGA